MSSECRVPSAESEEEERQIQALRQAVKSLGDAGLLVHRACEAGLANDGIADVRQAQAEGALAGIDYADALDAFDIARGWVLSAARVFTDGQA